MSHRLTPVAIEALMHYHYNPTPHPKAESTSVKNAVSHLIQNGIIGWDENSNTYSTTEKGVIFVEMICTTPLPEQKWADPREKS